MTTYNAAIMIQQSPATVWKILADLEAWPSWTSTMTRVEVLSSGEAGLGTKARILQPKLQPAVWEITEWQPGRSFAWKTTVLGTEIVANHVLERVDDQCRFSQSLTYHGLVGAILGMLYGVLTREYMQIEAQGLKRRAESTL
jgi:hypothetical protein